MKHKIFTMIALFVMSACMKIKKKEDEVTPPSPAVQTVLQLQQQSVIPFVNERASLEIEYVSERSQSLSSVLFKAPAGWPQEVIVRKTEGEKTSEFGIQFDESDEWLEYLTSTEKVNYRFYSQLGKDLIELEEISVLPVLDLEIKEDFNLFKRYQLDSKVKLIYIRNLEIDEQRNLFIESYSGKIQIQDITSRGGLIRTYSSETRAPDDQNGRHGGQVKIEIEKGEGMLTVVMQGENGGNGSPALLPDASIKGAQGYRGAPAQFTAVPCTGSFCFVMAYQCTTRPGDAGNGNQGLKGYSGKNGKAGGNSGSVWVHNKADSLAVTIQSIEGAAGYGSPGGLGGEGGEPGETADGGVNDLEIFYRAKYPNCQPHPVNGKCTGFMIRAENKCEEGKPGQKGLTGPEGDPGLPGSSGLKQLSCLYQNGVKTKCINE